MVCLLMFAGISVKLKKIYIQFNWYKCLRIAMHTVLKKGIKLMMQRILISIRKLFASIQHVTYKLIRNKDS